MSLESKANLESPTFTGTVSGITRAMVGLSNVDNTSDIDKPISKIQQLSLNYKQELLTSNSSLTIKKISTNEIVNNGDLTVKGNCYIGDQSADTVTFYNNMTINGITNSTVGLGNVDNTSDADKPVSTEQQAALDLKATKLDPVFTGTVTGVSAAMVGLGNVDNTSDADKPVSTEQQAALDLKAPIDSPQFSGIPIAPTATQDINTTQIATTAFVKLAISNLVDVAPTTLDTLKELSSALGADANFATTVTDSIASKAPQLNPVFTGTVTGVSAAMVGLGNVDNTSDAAKPVSTEQQSALNLKLNLSGGTVTGGFVSQQTTNIMEVISTATIESNAVTCNYASGGVYYLNGLASSTNFALTLTNCNPANSLNVTNTITLLINCASFQAYANSINVNGEAKSMIYSGGATAISLTGATMVCQTISVVYSGNASVPIYVISNVAPYFA